jgi:hypothetical protein
LVMGLCGCRTWLVCIDRRWLKIHGASWVPWLTPVILDTQEAEIRRIVDWSQHGQIVHKNQTWKRPITKKSLWSD